MKHPSQEEVKRQLRAVPENISAALSDENANTTLWQIANRNHLSEEKATGVVRLTGYVILGFVQPEELAHEIEGELHINHKVAAALSEEIYKKVLSPIFSGEYIASSVSLPQPDQAQQEVQLQNQPEQVAENVPEAQPINAAPPYPPPTPKGPVAKKEEPPMNQQPTEGASPFLIHQEKSNIEPVGRPSNESLMRPYFFEPTSTVQQAEERPTAARLEIGDVEEEKPVEPVVGKTEKEDVRVVNYSGPKSETNPFGRQEKNNPQQSKAPSQGEQASPEEVHPDNIVNLKDLPK